MEFSSFSKQHDVCFVTVIIFVQSRAFIVKMAGHSTGTEECGMLSKISTGISAKILQLCYITCLTGVLSSVSCLHLMRPFFCCCCRSSDILCVTSLLYFETVAWAPGRASDQ